MITEKRDIRLLLDDIRSAHNVGSIFRTAETLGITGIYCAGTTPDPVDRFGRKRKDLAKVSLGAEEMIPWEHVGDTSSHDEAIKALKKLKKEGFKIIALEQAEDSVDYKKVRLDARSYKKGTVAGGTKAVIILGNEVDGVSPKLLKLSDIIAEIPMRGKKESLNVSVATGIFLYRLLDF